MNDRQRFRLGERLAKIRVAHGDSLRDAALRTGVSHTTLARLERGEIHHSSPRTLQKIADGYRISIEYLLTGREPSTEFETLFRIKSMGDDRSGPVSVEDVEAYVALMRKALEQNIRPEILDLAIQILASKDRSAQEPKRNRGNCP